ncbi:MAG: hypothetical protein LKJ76_04795 [Lachnospiraceae bacterium]|jgi:hypothetical protein|nr:hypothetical protein [Lachnospiraceae bacterium]
MKSVIKARVAYQGFDVDRVLKGSGIKRTRYYKILSDPGSMRLDELRQLDDVLKFSDEDIAELTGRKK